MEEESLLVDGILVAGADPVAVDRVLRLFVLVPVAGAGGVAADQQVADVARGDRGAAFVDDPRLVPGNDGRWSRAARVPDDWR